MEHGLLDRAGIARAPIVAHRRYRFGAPVDQILRLVQENIRTTDYMIRFGGDEFIIVTPTTDIRHAEMVVDKINQAIQGFDFGIGSSVASSIGIAEYEEPDTVDSLLSRVDKALYKAKARNKS